MLTWTDYPALRAERNLTPKILAEVDAHVTNPGYWESSDHGNWCHEGTHGCNADIRNAHGNQPGLYLGGTQCLLLTHPKTTIREVAQLMPEAFHGFEYDVYCVRQASQWDSEPLYLWDEWSAYINGAQAETDKAPVARPGWTVLARLPARPALRHEDDMVPEPVAPGAGRGYTLSEYLPIGLALALVDGGLPEQERLALEYMLTLTALFCDRGHKYITELVSGAAGQAYRDKIPMLVQAFSGDGDVDFNHLARRK